MGDGPRRRRASAWAWVYLALFGTGDEGADTAVDATTEVGESPEETPDSPELR